MVHTLKKKNYFIIILIALLIITLLISVTLKSNKEYFFSYDNSKIDAITNVVYRNGRILNQRPVDSDGTCSTAINDCINDKRCGVVNFNPNNKVDNRCVSRKYKPGKSNVPWATAYIVKDKPTSIYTAQKRDCYIRNADIGYRGRANPERLEEECDSNPNCKGFVNRGWDDYWMLSNTDTTTNGDRRAICYSKPNY